jgi:hypothetical protein
MVQVLRKANLPPTASRGKLQHNISVPVPENLTDSEARMLGQRMTPLLQRYPLPGTIIFSRFIPVLVEKLIKESVDPKAKKKCALGRSRSKRRACSGL